MALEQKMNACIVRIEVYSQDQFFSWCWPLTDTIHTRSFLNKQADFVSHYPPDSPSFACYPSIIINTFSKVHPDVG